MIPCTVPGCDAMVSSKKGLMAHLKSSKHVPLKDKSHCEVCKEDVNLQPKKRAKRYTEDSLKEHMKRHKQTAASITPLPDTPLSRDTVSESEDSDGDEDDEEEKQSTS